MLKGREQLHGIKFGFQTLNFAVVFLLELRDKPVELIPSNLDLLIKHFGPLLQVATNVAHLILARFGHALLKPSWGTDTWTSSRRRGIGTCDRGLHQVVGSVLQVIAGITHQLALVSRIFSSNVQLWLGAAKSLGPMQHSIAWP
jgi:hypothetical protein